MVELFIDGYNIDISEQNDIELAYTINDVRNPISTNRNWSKTFDIPGTQNNNILFKFLFDGKIVRGYNPNLKKSCEIRVDGLSIIRGYVKLTDIDIVKNAITYKIVIYGENLDLFDQMDDALLSELDFTEYDHEFSMTAVTNTWLNTDDNDGFYYPWMNYNSFPWSYQTLQPFTYNSVSYTYSDQYPFFPAFFCSTIVNKIMDTYGFTLNSTFMDTNVDYKNLFIPFTNAADNTQSNIVVWHNSQYQQYSTEYVPEPFPHYQDSYVFYYTYISSIDLLSLMSGQTQIITPAQGKWSFTITGETITGTGWEFISGSFTIYSRKLDNTLTTTLYHADLLNPASKTTKYTFSFTYTFEEPVPADRKIYIQLFGVGTPHQVYKTGFEYTISFTSAFETLVPHMNMNASQILPNDLKQKDFFKTIINMFNLYIETTGTTITIEPYNTFFFNDSKNPVDWNVLDWTYKVDETSRKHKLLSEINASSYLFTYKTDNDQENVNYKNNVAKVAGQLIKFVENDFVSNQNKIELPAASTIIKYIPGGSGNNMFYPSMSVKNENELIPSGIIEYTDILWSGFTGIINTKWNWRILRKYVEDNYNPEWVYYDGDYWYWFTAYQLGFGSSDTNYTIDPSHSLYDTFWKDYIDMINNQNSRLLTMDAFLSEVDISDLSFRNIIFVNDSYYILNNLLYNPITRQSQLELLLIPSTDPSSLIYENFVVPDTTLYETQHMNISVDITNNSQGEEAYSFLFTIFWSTGGTYKVYSEVGYVPRKSTITITRDIVIDDAGSYNIRYYASPSYYEVVPVVVTQKYYMTNYTYSPNPAPFACNLTISYDIVVPGYWTGNVRIGVRYIDTTYNTDFTFSGPGTQSGSKTFNNMSMGTKDFYVSDNNYYISEHLYVPIIPREPTQGAWTALDYNTLTMHWDSRNECDLGNDWEIATDTGFTNIVQSGNVSNYATTSKVITGLNDNTYYVTRVRGKATGPIYSVWSGGVQGTTPVYAASFEITSPASMFSNFGGSGAVCDDATLHISSNCNWSGTTDATWIHGYAGTYSGNAVLYTYVDSNPGTNRGDAITFYYWDGINEYQYSPPQVYLQMADGENCPV